MSRQPVSKYHANKALVNINLLNGKNKNIVKNPGCAFATGNHFTNRLCIRFLENIFRHYQINNILDVGSGSGILAIYTIL